MKFLGKNQYFYPKAGVKKQSFNRYTVAMILVTLSRFQERFDNINLFLFNQGWLPNKIC